MVLIEKLLVINTNIKDKKIMGKNLVKLISGCDELTPKKIF